MQLDTKQDLNTSRHTWNERWSRRGTGSVGTHDDWLERFQYMLPKGTALDVACGSGRNAIYLAEHGFEVTAVDISEIALDKLSREARKRGLRITLIQQDVEQELTLPAGPFDVVMNFMFLHRPLLPVEMSVVRPGGVMVMRTFSSTAVQKSEQRAEISLKARELQAVFSDWRTLYYEEGVQSSAKHGPLAGIIAERPTQSWM